MYVTLNISYFVLNLVIITWLSLSIMSIHHFKGIGIRFNLAVPLYNTQRKIKQLYIF